MIKRFLNLPLFVFAYLLVANSTLAVNTPSFPLCPNPGGNTIASYDSGTHGVVGDYSAHTGSDYVYKTSKTTYVQCFCPKEGNSGIETKWWNVSGLSQDEIKGLENSGWIFIPNGANWGLSNDIYLAVNSQFSCGNGSVQGQGQVLGASTSILAATNSNLILPRILAAIFISIAIFIVLVI